MPLRPIAFLVFSCLLAMPGLAKNRLRVATASNFLPTLEQIAAAFESDFPETSVSIVSGSTGKLYTQIQAGAPFDAFFAADAERPALLEKTQIALPNSRFTYALGILVAWPADSTIDTSSPLADFLKAPDLTISIANPQLAPYGRAATESLAAMGFDRQDNQPRIVQAENVAQAFHYAHTGAAQLAFVSLAQVKTLPADKQTYWLTPENNYAPIVQQAVQLTDSPAATNFLAFVRSEKAKTLIEAAGYRIP